VEVGQQQLLLQPQPLLQPQSFPQLLPQKPLPPQQHRIKMTMMMSHRQEQLLFPELKHMDLSPHLKSLR